MANRIAPGFTIEAASDGGFYVLHNREFGMSAWVAFAGSLTDCLEYVRSKLAAPKEAQEQAA